MTMKLLCKYLDCDHNCQNGPNGKGKVIEGSRQHSVLQNIQKLTLGKNIRGRNPSDPIVLTTSRVNDHKLNVLEG